MSEHTNHEQDTREKLEADLNDWCWQLLENNAVLGYQEANHIKREVWKLLDRQAAITKTEIAEDYNLQPDTSSQTVRNGDSYNFDTREQLEADLKTHMYEFGGYCFNSREGHADNVDTFFDDFIGLLDRQAAITEEKTRYKWVTASAEEIAAWRSKAEKLKEQVYELTAERDEWKTKCETREVAYKQADAERKRYSEQIDELTVERDELERANNRQARKITGVCSLNDAQSKRIKELEAERDELRDIIAHMPKTEAECEACQEAHDRLMFNAKVHQDELRDELKHKQLVIDRQRDSFAKMEREYRELQDVCGELERTIENMRGD